MYICTRALPQVSFRKDIARGVVCTVLSYFSISFLLPVFPSFMSFYLPFFLLFFSAPPTPAPTIHSFFAFTRRTLNIFFLFVSILFPLPPTPSSFISLSFSHTPRIHFAYNSNIPSKRILHTFLIYKTYHRRVNVSFLN